MKRILQLIAISLALSGCFKKSEKVDQGVSSGIQESAYDLVLYIDRMTGCHYISGVHGLTPRLQPDGKHYCRAADVTDPANRALFYGK
jgi:hypothetical protein